MPVLGSRFSVLVQRSAMTTTETKFVVAPAFVVPDMVSPAITRMIDQVRPSVVQVRSDGHGGGAGVVWRSDGAVVTNHHVVAHTQGPIRVQLPDGREFGARVTAQNAALDLALLEVEGDNLPAAPVGDSSRL